MLEALAINGAAAGLAAGASIAAGKLRDIFRRKRFSEDVSDLATEFNTALRDAVADALERDDREYHFDTATDWPPIADQLDEIDVAFENEQDAIVQITDAVGDQLDADLDTHPNLRETLEAAVADAYQTALCDFADRVAGTDLADVLTTETNLELIQTVNSFDDRLTAIQRQLRRDTAALRNVGVTRLDTLYFERAPDPTDPDTAWRTGFDFPEVDAGYPLPRERPAPRDDDIRRSLTDEIRTRLDDGESLVVLGDGGSGKSTVCKQLAHHWHADTDRGPVFY